MFTGIIENLSEIKEIIPQGDNLSISFSSNLTKELKIDQSIAHNGICLTVVEIDNDTIADLSPEIKIIKETKKTLIYINTFLPDK